MTIFLFSKLLESEERNIRLANELEDLHDKHSKVVDKQQLADCKNFTLTMLKADISSFENGVDLDQLASKKPADRDLLCFPLCL